MERFIFDGLDDLLVALRAGQGHVAYLVLQDRTVRGVDDTVDRFDLTPEHARRVLPPDDPDDEDDPPDVIDAAEVWLRRTAAEVTEDRGERRFRVRFMGPKGAAMVHSAQFVCRDTATPAPEPPAELVMPVADFSAVEHSPVTQSLHALGAHQERHRAQCARGGPPVSAKAGRRTRLSLATSWASAGP